MLGPWGEYSASYILNRIVPRCDAIAEKERNILRWPWVQTAMKAIGKISCCAFEAYKTIATKKRI